MTVQYEVLCNVAEFKQFLNEYSDISVSILTPQQPWLFNNNTEVDDWARMPKI